MPEGYRFSIDGEKEGSKVSDRRFDAEGFFLTAVDQARYQRVLESLVSQGEASRCCRVPGPWSNTMASAC